MRTIVLDTNCLLAVLPSISPYHQVWIDILAGEICICISNEILGEYEEILVNKTNPIVAQAVVRALLEAPKIIKRVEPTFYYHMITADPDDNKFVDCAICGNAELLVTNDAHFDILKTIEFPKVEVIKLQEYIKLRK
ncbi:MAG: putative toxin-antitoxin system toxin component, PIN family [Bacteroidales bacterium]|nr:putative toxin-antitoxin system toxin component, PIN family [Bacteroidales bacterium]